MYYCIWVVDVLIGCDSRNAKNIEDKPICNSKNEDTLFSIGQIVFVNYPYKTDENSFCWLIFLFKLWYTIIQKLRGNMI